LPATTEHLRGWTAAGLIDPATAERILLFEAERAKGREADRWRPSVPELLVYLAAAITGAGLAVLVATNWEQLASGPRVAIPLLSSIAVFMVGYGLRRIRNDAMLRGASLLWLLTGALVVGSAAVAAAEAGWSENDVALAGGIVAVIAAVGLWMPMRMHPQIVGMGAAAVLFSTAIGSRFPEDYVSGVLGASLGAFGLAALGAVERWVLVPRSSARLLAGAALGVGGFVAGMPPGPPAMELIAVGAVIVLLLAGIRLQSLVYVTFGVLTAFGGMLTVILRYVDSPTLAGLALVAVGLLLMLAIAGLTRTQPWSRTREASLRQS
jgi:uncharacterized membrane protein